MYDVVRIRRNKSQGLTRDLVKKLDVANDENMTATMNSLAVRDTNMYQPVQNNTNQNSLMRIKCSSATSLPYRPLDTPLDISKNIRRSNESVLVATISKMTENKCARGTNGSGLVPMPRPSGENVAEVGTVQHKISHSSGVPAVSEGNKSVVRSSSSVALSRFENGTSTVRPVSRMASAGIRQVKDRGSGCGVAFRNTGPVVIGRQVGPQKFQSHSQQFEIFNQAPSSKQRSIGRQMSHNPRNAPTWPRLENCSPQYFNQYQELKCSSYGADLNNINDVNSTARATKQVSSKLESRNQSSQSMGHNDASFIDSLVQCVDLDGLVRGAPFIHDKNSRGRNAGHKVQRRSFSYDHIQIAANDPIPATQSAQEQLPVIENDEPARNMSGSLKSLPRNTSVNSWTRCESSSSTAESRSGFNFQEVASEVSRGTKNKTPVRYGSSTTSKADRVEQSMSMIEFLETCSPPGSPGKTSKTSKFTFTKFKSVKAAK